jgi:MSHA biogenesis protein MshJ
VSESIRLVVGRFESLSLRERVLVAASVVATVWMLWDWTLHQALERKVVAARGDVASLQQRIVTEQDVAERLRQRMEDDPNRALAAESRELSQQIAAVDERLETIVGGFVEPSMMPVLLEDVVRHHHGVTLQRVASLPVEPIRQDSGDVVSGLFRHAMRVELHGGYFAVRDYLDELEKAPWRFAWRSLDYRVDAYPQATVVLEVETMSREKNWLGV